MGYTVHSVRQRRGEPGVLVSGVLLVVCIGLVLRYPFFTYRALTDQWNQVPADHPPPTHHCVDWDRESVLCVDCWDT